jgi:hypothetical protein
MLPTRCFACFSHSELYRRRGVGPRAATATAYSCTAYAVPTVADTQPCRLAGRWCGRACRVQGLEQLRPGYHRFVVAARWKSAPRVNYAVLAIWAMIYDSC